MQSPEGLPVPWGRWKHELSFIAQKRAKAEEDQGAMGATEGMAYAKAQGPERSNRSHRGPPGGPGSDTMRSKGFSRVALWPDRV